MTYENRYNTIESLNMSLHKIIKTRASFPSDEAAFKLLYLASVSYTHLTLPTKRIV